MTEGGPTDGGATDSAVTNRGATDGAVKGTDELLRLDGSEPDAGRRLFRYITGEEWQEYRQIMAIFAGTFFAEFTIDEVAQRLVAVGVVLDPGVVSERLESLRRWGNLTVSSATGTPSSLADYYRRRNRYLITRAGQEVHEVVEGVLARVDEVRDVSTGRLRSLRDALRALADTDIASCNPQHLADLVRAVFDPHQAFTSEITQFFAAINQWQSRYDLTPEEFSFFAQVLVGYVTERLDEIERISRPIAVALQSIRDRVPSVVERVGRGLAARVEESGLADAITVARTPGSSVEDWDRLADWFVPRGLRPARMDQLRRDALAAIRTLTLNLTRLSRVGVGESSRRADLLHLARWVADAPGDEAARLVNAAFGLYSPSHYGRAGADADDPVGPTTSWWDAPAAVVPISLRERGDTASRGNASPMPDRSAAQRALRYQRQQEATAARRIDAELLAWRSDDGVPLSVLALARLEQLVGRALTLLSIRGRKSEVTEGGLTCRVQRQAGHVTVLTSSEGTLTLRDLAVSLQPAARAERIKDGVARRRPSDAPRDSQGNGHHEEPAASRAR
jgi:uncharacterized protein (TIGR02677 family)